jgi:hypothetical protein
MRQGRALTTAARDDGEGRGVNRETREVNGASFTLKRIPRVLILVEFVGMGHVETIIVCGDSTMTMNLRTDGANHGKYCPVFSTTSVNHRS